MGVVEEVERGGAGDQSTLPSPARVSAPLQPFQTCSSECMDRSLLLPQAPPALSRSWPPAWVAQPSGHPCSDHFVALWAPRCTLSCCPASPRLFCGSPPWSSPQTLERRPLRGPHSESCAVRPLSGPAPPLLRHQHHHHHHTCHLECSAPPPPQAPPPSAVSVPPPSPQPVPGEHTRRHCSSVSPRGLCHKSRVSCTRKPLGSRRPLPGPGCHPGPPLGPAGLSPDMVRAQPPGSHCGRQAHCLTPDLARKSQQLTRWVMGTFTGSAQRESQKGLAPVPPHHPGLAPTYTTRFFHNNGASSWQETFADRTK